MTYRSGQQFHGRGTTGKEEVHALIAANVVCRVGAPMQALVAQGANRTVDGVGKVGIDQQIHVRRRADHTVGSKCQAANEGTRSAEVIKTPENFLNLSAQP
jgi:hypothetical protein